MNNEKIGKFIRKLRKAKNLTQQELGDMVGVGGKSVSKWERGINMPDISIINEVSRILGITSDELLKGEFDKHSENKEYRKKKNQQRYRLLLVVLLIITTIFTILLIFHFKNDTHKYWMADDSENYEVEGYIEYDKHGYTINIDTLYCKLTECQDLYINNLRYSISINNIIVYMYHNSENLDNYHFLNEYLADKKIIITDNFVDSIISYNDVANLEHISIIIEGYDIYNNSFKYLISLKTDDKKS